MKPIKVFIKKIINELGETEWIITVGILLICAIISLAFILQSEPTVVEVIQEYLQ